jgi:valyl-tRNA synthetase
MTASQMDKNFDYRAIEEKWNQQWLNDDIFMAHKYPKRTEPYVIMMPPPNVTGVLHNGHALFVTLQDILARFWRMKGRDVLWLPGTDHAGIATQTVVERELMKKEGKTRHDLGRDQFLELVFAWKDKHGSHIIEQLKLMGASADWSRLKFTMDEQCSHAVRHAFVELWNQGLIYRKERLISWDPGTKTALSNEEVDHVEHTGELSYFAYLVKDDPKLEIIVATTRLETMLGDTAVAVNPQDARYKHLIGKELIHPFINNRKIKVIGDDYVDKEFGSGAVKITPAHDPNDFQIGTRHALEFINIFNLDLTVNEVGGEFAGLDRMVARKKVRERLTELNLFRKSEAITHSISVSQRSGEVVEPMLSRQYFVNAKPLAKKAYDAVENGEVRIIPAPFKKIYDHFLLNIEDWCISRQLWWGHRIPVYYHVESMKAAVVLFGQKQKSLSAQALAENQDLSRVLRLALDELDESSIRQFSIASVEPPADMGQYIQEEDVLDTWFSAGLWPFSTLGWPEQTEDLARYYPGDVLETGSDILFFWVARMMMFGIHFMGKPPFKDIYLHSMVRDAHGRKMSKSLGNAIDPIDVIHGISLEDLVAKTKTYPVPPKHLPQVLEGIKKDFPEGIPSSGADGLRLSLAMFSGQGRDVKFSVPRVVGYRAFLNKVWNATRFATMHVSGAPILPLDEAMKEASTADRYIIAKLNIAIGLINEHIKEYRFSDAAEALYQFFWTEYCDRYIECAKVSFKKDSPRQQQITESILIHLLDASMRLMHPFCPFISEEIWQSLPTLAGYKKLGINYCALAPYPEAASQLIDADAVAQMEMIFEAAAMTRNARQSADLPANQAIPVIFLVSDQSTLKSLEKNSDLLAHLTKASSIELALRGSRSVEALSATNSNLLFDVVIELKGLIDVEKEVNRLTQTLQKIAQQKAGLESRLGNAAFVAKAPKEVVELHENEVKELVEREKQLVAAKERLLKG